MGWALVAGAHIGAAHAEAPARCERTVTRATVVSCALATSPAVQEQQHAADAARAREQAAAVVLPANPILSVSVASRTPAAGAGVVNWAATFAQEIEIAGQRGARLAAARVEIDAQSRRGAVAEREIAAAALTAYFDAIAAREHHAIAVRAAAVGEAVLAAVSARAGQGLATPIDADVAYAASIRRGRARVAAERRVTAATAALAAVVGADPTKGPTAIEGELVPLAIPVAPLHDMAERALAARGEVAAASLEGVANEHRASVLRRARVPNLTLSAFVQNDGFHERVLGGGISIPIPLPSPLGRTNAGAIAEASALARRAEAHAERLRREIRLEVVVAAHAFASRRAEVDAIDVKRLARAEGSLRMIAQQIEAGALSVRDALTSQEELLQLLMAHVEARAELCFASVNLARVMGMGLERGAT